MKKARFSIYFHSIVSGFLFYFFKMNLVMIFGTRSWKETIHVFLLIKPIQWIILQPSNPSWKQVAKEGIPLPSDRTICPLCSQKRANPSVVAVSGFVFCYACIFKYVSQVRFPDSFHLIFSSRIGIYFCAIKGLV